LRAQLCQLTNSIYSSLEKQFNKKALRCIDKKVLAKELQETIAELFPFAMQSGAAILELRNSLQGTNSNCDLEANLSAFQASRKYPRKLLS